VDVVIALFVFALVIAVPITVIGLLMTARNQVVPPEHAAPAGWYVDPLHRHERRYWDGDEWTADVVDSGEEGFDPLKGEGS
jgi:hypothetical protein